MSRYPTGSAWHWLLSFVGMIFFVSATVEFFRPQGSLSPQAWAERSLRKAGVAISPVSVFEAVRSGDAQTLQLLAQAGQDVSLWGAEGMTPLMLGAARGDSASVRVLLEAGAEVHSKDSKGRTALSHALLRPSLSSRLKSLLYFFGADPNSLARPGESLLLAAVRAGDYEGASELLEHGADPNGALGQVLEESPLRAAVSAGNQSMISLLLEHQVDVHEPRKSSDFRPPLFHVAASAGNRQVCQQLVEAGCDPDQYHLGATSLRNALLERRSAFAWDLLAMGASVSRVEKEALEPILHSLARNGDAESSRLLLDSGYTYVEDGLKPSPLEWAWRVDDPELFALLLEHDLPAGRLHWQLIAARAWDYLDLLAAHGVRFDEVGEGGETPLGVAVGEQDLELLAYLLEIGVDPQGAGRDGQTAFVGAIASSSPEMLALLLQHGADPKAVLASPAQRSFRQRFPNDVALQHSLQVDGQFTPLMLAAAMGSEPMVKLLLDAGAEKWAKTTRYKSYALYLAGIRRHAGVQQILVGRDPSPEKQERTIVISLNEQRARLYEGGAVKTSTPVSTGKEGYRTPRGTFVLTSKHRHHRSNLYDDASMPYFMRLSCDAFGLHEGRVPSYPASHGCIRVPAGTARQLFTKMKVGDRVIISE